MNILVTGGCGYVGSVLVRELLAKNHQVTVVDAMWFGDRLAKHPHLKVVKADLRNIDLVPLEGIETVIHLGNVANDPCVELSPKLSWEVNTLATMQLADRCVRSGVKQLMYASSGSVYGVKTEESVTEDLTTDPISEYNKTKMVSDRVILSYKDQMSVQCIRPATVCGLSPRMRLDLSVNLLTMQALTKGVITVLGGDQLRPNIHIEDMVGVYLHFLEKGRAHTGVFNAGFENMSIMNIAKLIQERMPADIVVKESNDPRSYRLNSEKLLKTGYVQKKTVKNAVEELIAAYKSGSLKDDDSAYNIRWMKQNIDTILTA